MRFLGGKPVKSPTWIMRYLSALTKCANLRTPAEYIFVSNRLCGDDNPSIEDRLLRSEILSMGLRKFPDGSDLLVARGTNYHCLSRPDQALTDLNRAEVIAPHCSSQFFITRAEIYESKNELEKAHQEYLKASRADQSNPKGFGGAARVLLKLGKPARALHYANRAVYIAERRPYWLWLRSQCLAKTGHLDNAISDAQFAVENVTCIDQDAQRYQEHLNQLMCSARQLAG